MSCFETQSDFEKWLEDDALPGRVFATSDESVCRAFISATEVVLRARAENLIGAISTQPCLVWYASDARSAKTTRVPYESDKQKGSAFACRGRDKEEYLCHSSWVKVLLSSDGMSEVHWIVGRNQSLSQGNGAGSSLLALKLFVHLFGI